MPTLTEIFNDFVSLVYPRYCLACSEGLVKGEELVCTRCIHDLPKTGYHLTKENPLYKRLFGRIPLQSAFSFLIFSKGGKVQRLMHELKYNNHPEIGVVMGKVYGDELANNGFAGMFDLILPIPLHPSKQRQRGYNQSEKFAMGLADKLRVTCLTGALYRQVKTDTQTRKSKLKRWENVKDVFVVQNQEAIKNKSILLVDDVITTGATVEACAISLLQAQCKTLSICSMAYAEE